MFPPCQHSGRVVRNEWRFCKHPDKPRKAFLDSCLSCPLANTFNINLEPVCTPIIPTGEICVHRGSVLRIDTCELCGSRGKQVPIRSCAVHGECSDRRYKSGKGPASCLACPDAKTPCNLQPLDGQANLVWFVYPRKETREVWEQQQAVVRESLSRFDGKTLCIVAADTLTAHQDIDASEWDDVRYIENNIDAREVGAWRIGMEQMKLIPGFTVWLHAKGATRGTPELHLKRWWELAYESLLDADSVRAALQQHRVAGCFRINSRAGNLGADWHFSGGMYAVRNDCIAFPPSEAGGWYAEAWPGLIAEWHESFCLRYDGVKDLYVASNWREVASAVTGTR